MHKPWRQLIREFFSLPPEVKESWDKIVITYIVRPIATYVKKKWKNSLLERVAAKLIRNFKKHYIAWFVTVTLVVSGLYYLAWIKDRRVAFSGRVTQGHLTHHEELVLSTRVYRDVVSQFWMVEGIKPFQMIKKDAPEGPLERIYRLVRRFIDADIPYTAQWDWNVPNLIVPDVAVFPGGKIIITRGMLEMLPEDDTIGAILAHAIGHAISLHGSERVTSSRLTDLGDLVVNGEAVRFNQKIVWGIAGSFGADRLLHLPQPYTREQEIEADEVGLIVMAMACFDPTAMITIWDRLKRFEFGENKLEFLTTHVFPDGRTLRLSEKMHAALKIRSERCIGDKMKK